MRASVVLGVSLAGLVWAATVRSPSEAAAVLDALLGGTSTDTRGAPATKGQSSREGAPLFVSDVRLVNLSVSITDRKGRPVPGLKPDGFEVVEDGIRQKVAVAGAEEVPFNLVLLLDLSGSTIRDRTAMKEAALRFAGVARTQDRVAVYALAGDQFQVISTLTGYHARTRQLIEQVPDLSGASPVYASIALAWNEELARRSGERNAMIVLSDGIDDSIEKGQGPVSFERLRRAAAVMPVLIYPVYLDSRNIFYGERARRQMRLLADASGGRLFSARSLKDLEPVYAEVAEELRSVYTLAYYPNNQTFDGRWRRVQVRTTRPALTLRTRPGYYAR